ncbi:MAG: hypothetical protein FWD24_08805 [Treponema sp.]|nr:hypothetical protein [Treponema sp.]
MKNKLLNVIMILTIGFIVISCGDEPNPPEVSAGNAQTVTLSDTLTVTLSGTATPADSNDSITSRAWTCTDYKADKGAVVTPYTTTGVTAMIQNSNTNTATVNLRKAGTYTFQFSATDSNDKTTTKQVNVTVNAINANKDVTVNFPAYTPGSAISFAPSYVPDGGWGDHFSATDITYTLADDLSNTWDSAAGFNGIVNIGDGPYNPFTIPTFTQTFKLNGVTVGSQVIKVDAVIGSFGILKDASGSNLDPQAIPAVPLALSKDVTEL